MHLSLVENVLHLKKVFSYNTFHMKACILSNVNVCMHSTKFYNKIPISIEY